MRISVISASGAPASKTALSILLTTVYPIASDKEAIYVTNKSLQETLSYIDCVDEEVHIEKSLEILTSLSTSHSISDDDVYDYAYIPVQRKKSFFFDAFSEIIPYDEAFEKCMNIVDRFHNKFIVMDINGDPYSDEVQKFINVSDVILVTFRPIIKDVHWVRKFIESLSEEDRLKYKFICTPFADNGIKKKNILSVIGFKRPKSIYWFPLNSTIITSMYDGVLCHCATGMIGGYPTVLNLRDPMKTLLSDIMDSKGVHVIKEVNKWK